MDSNELSGMLAVVILGSEATTATSPGTQDLQLQGAFLYRPKANCQANTVVVIGL